LLTEVKNPAAPLPERAWQWNLWKSFRPRAGVRHVARYERVLGTSLELQVVAESREQARTAEAAVLQEIDRLEAIFSAYRPDSELRRWQETCGRPESVSPELAEVLALSDTWRKQTGSAFHPAVESLTRLWRQAAECGIEPDADTLRHTVHALQSPLWAVDTDRRMATRLTHLPVTLNAIAKGYILDSACQIAQKQPGVRAALINIGGDIRQSGGVGAPVGVDDPFAPHENAPLLETIRLHNRGIATSGNYRRGFKVADRRYSHLLDPRTGYPVEHVVSASVVAETAMLADILATAFSVLTPDESLRLADTLPDVGVLLVAQDGGRRSNSGWRQQIW
jgi:thiamine biosynthesis lipoprotein ApbE